MMTSPSVNYESLPTAQPESQKHQTYGAVHGAVHGATHADPEATAHTQDGSESGPYHLQDPVHNGGSIRKRESDDSESQSRCRRVLCCWGKVPLTLRILVGCALGVVVGFVIQMYNPSEDVVMIVGYIGELFIRALRLIVIPFIALSMLTSPSKVGDIAVSKRLGKHVIMYYATTTLLAVTEGLIFYNIFRPGRGQDPGDVEEEQEFTDKSIVDALLDIGRAAIDENIFSALVNTNILGVIVFSLWLGYIFSHQQHTSEATAVMIKIMEDFNHGLMRMIETVIDYTPIAVFSLIAGQIVSGDIDPEILSDLGYYIATLMTALLFHMLVTYPVLYFIFIRKNPYIYLLRLNQPMITAFTTSSSAATIPINIKTAEENGIAESIAEFVIPLGATINMDGGSIKYPIAAIFLAALAGDNMSFGRQVMTAIVSAFISMGAAPIPNAGVVFLLLVMNAVNIPDTRYIALILSIEWLSDRVETMVNITGDAIGAAVINAIDKKAIDASHRRSSKESSDWFDAT